MSKEKKGIPAATDADLAKEMLQPWGPTTLLAIAAEIAALCYVYSYTNGHFFVQSTIVLAIALNAIGLLAGPKAKRRRYRTYILAVAQVKAIKGMPDEPNLDFTGPNIDEASFRLGYTMRGQAVTKRLAQVEQLGAGILAE